MKKNCLMGILALLCSLVMALPAFAVDLEYGGYWRTRAYTMDGFSGDKDDESNDLSKIDARGRLWTKHIVNEEMSWTNRIEFNVVWGDELHGGGVGTDGTDYIRFKHSYVDLDTVIAGQDLHFTIGLQPYTAAKGMLFDDDFAGMILSHRAGDNDFKLIWMKVFEGSTLSGEYEKDLEDLDVNFVGFAPEFNLLNDTLKVNAYGFYLFSEDAREWSGTTGNQDVSVVYLGAEVNYALSMGNVWGVLLYETGTADVVYSDVEYDMNAYIAAIGANINLDALGVHGQIFYASGDDDLDDSDVEGFYVPRGQSYYWSEIMGLGVFDAVYSNGSPGDVISNVIACNIGVSYEVNEDLNLTGDVWYAEHAETNALVSEDALGTEVDLRADYKVNDDLNLTVVGAYLFADNATTMDAADDADTFEIGLMLSFKFKSE
jgi:hypothetical protein